MEYEKGYVYKLMDQGGPTNCKERYFKEASEEIWKKCVYQSFSNFICIRRH